MKIKSLVSLIALTSLAYTGNAVAATQGTLGTSSEGETVITLAIQDRVQITGVGDIAFGAYSGSGNFSKNDTFCVYRNGGDGYTMTLTTDSGGFNLTEDPAGGSPGTIPFTVKVHGSTSSASLVALAYNTASATYSGASAANCGSTDNAMLEVSMLAADLQAASSANYKETLQITVAPI